MRPRQQGPCGNHGSRHHGTGPAASPAEIWVPMRGLRPATADEEAHAEALGDQKQSLDVLDEAGFTSVVATNCEQEYFRELVPGDQISHEVTTESISAEKKTGLGVGHFVTQLYTYKDAAGEVVATMRFRILKFRPPS